MSSFYFKPKRAGIKEDMGCNPGIDSPTDGMGNPVVPEVGGHAGSGDCWGSGTSRKTGKKRKIILKKHGR